MTSHGRGAFNTVVICCAGHGKCKHISFYRENSNNTIVVFAFFIDVLVFAEGTSSIVDGEYGGESDRIVYGVFTTPKNSVAGNAICAFRMRKSDAHNC